MSIFSLFFLVGSSYSLSGIVWMVYLIARLESKSRLPPVYEHEGDILFHLVLFIRVFFIFYIAYLIRQERLSRMWAEKLTLSEGRVKNHVSNILHCLGLRDRTQAAIYAHEHNLL